MFKLKNEKKIENYVIRVPKNYKNNSSRVYQNSVLFFS